MKERTLMEAEKQRMLRNLKRSRMHLCRVMGVYMDAGQEDKAGELEDMVLQILMMEKELEESLNARNLR